ADCGLWIGLTVAVIGRVLGEPLVRRAAGTRSAIQSAIRNRGPHGADCAPWGGSPQSAMTCSHPCPHLEYQRIPDVDIRHERRRVHLDRPRSLGRAHRRRPHGGPADRRGAGLWRTAVEQAVLLRQHSALLQDLTLARRHVQLALTELSLTLLELARATLLVQR